MTVFQLSTFIASLFLSTHPHHPPVNIQITVEGLTAGTAKLVGVNGDQNYLADTAKIGPNGQINLSKAEPYRSGLYFLVLPDNSNIQFLVDKDLSFSLKTTKTDVVGAMQVEGSIDNQLFYENLKFQKTLEPKFNAIHAKLLATQRGTPEYQDLKAQEDKMLGERNAQLDGYRKNYPNTLFTKFKIAGQNPNVGEYLRPDGVMDTTLQVFVFRSHYWDDFDFSDDCLMRTPVLHNKLKAFMLQLTAQNPDSINASADVIIDKSLKNKELFKFISNWIALQYKPTQTALMDGEAVYSHIILKYFTKERAFWSDSAEIKGLRDQANNMRFSLIGMKGKDVWGTDKAGVRRSLYQNKAAATILFIYNPDCEHCQEQTPKLRQVYDQYKSRGVEVFAIASQTDEAKWKAFGPKYGVNWTDVRDPNFQSNYHIKYYIDITPEIYVLNKEYIIVAKNLKPDQLPEILDNALAQ